VIEPMKRTKGSHHRLLRRVFGILDASEHACGIAKADRAMSIDQRGKGPLFAGDRPTNELRIIRKR
jgi:hypothetical protein